MPFLQDELIELLKQIKPDLGGRNSIPKNLAEILLDMWDAMTNCADMYDSKVQQKIYEAADHLTYYARDICAT